MQTRSRTYPSSGTASVAFTRFLTKVVSKRRTGGCSSIGGEVVIGVHVAGDDEQQDVERAGEVEAELDVRAGADPAAEAADLLRGVTLELDVDHRRQAEAGRFLGDHRGVGGDRAARPQAAGAAAPPPRASARPARRARRRSADCPPAGRRAAAGRACRACLPTPRLLHTCQNLARSRPSLPEIAAHPKG